ncbi:hypothetical protein KAX75_05495 [candidate division WOR-3 bacterium]|nr:hypothetical protein [candidate division WOR-3 bacterium]
MSIWIIIGVIITILTLYTLIKTITKDFYDLLLFKNRKKKIIFNKIKEWYNYIDSHLSARDLDFDKIGNIEKEIDFMFSKKSNKYLILHFTKRFRNNFLKEIGIKKDLQGKEKLFIRYSRLNHKNITTALNLIKEEYNKNYPFYKVPFQYYWWVIRGNFYNFHSQFKTEWKNLKKDERKYSWPDIEIPIRILRRYFKD